MGKEFVYFTGKVPGIGAELCRVDTRTDTLSIAADIYSGPGSSQPHNRDLMLADHSLCVLGNRLLFAADDGVHGVEPFAWKHGATAIAFGRECGSGALESSRDPHVGSTVVLQYAASASTPRIHVLALGVPSFAGLRLPNSSCSLHLEPSSWSPVLVASTSSWSRAVGIPNRTALFDARVAWQVLTLDQAVTRYEASTAALWVLGP